MALQVKAPNKIVYGVILSEGSRRPTCHGISLEERCGRFSGSVKDAPQQIDEEKSSPWNT